MVMVSYTSTDMGDDPTMDALKRSALSLIRVKVSLANRCCAGSAKVPWICACWSQ